MFDVKKKWSIVIPTPPEPDEAQVPLIKKKKYLSQIIN